MQILFKLNFGLYEYIESNSRPKYIYIYAVQSVKLLEALRHILIF